MTYDKVAAEHGNPFYEHLISMELRIGTAYSAVHRDWPEHSQCAEEIQVGGNSDMTN